MSRSAVAWRNSLARALIAELVRRYWILGIECSLLEIQKLPWFLEREIEVLALPNPLDLQFSANRYGPYANRLDHLLDGLDGSFLRSQVRIPDAKPTDVIAFNDPKKDVVAADIKAGLQVWPGGAGAGERKLRLFDDRMLTLAIERLTRVGPRRT